MIKPVLSQAIGRIISPSINHVGGSGGGGGGSGAAPYTMTVGGQFGSYGYNGQFWGSVDPLELDGSTIKGMIGASDTNDVQISFVDNEQPNGATEYTWTIDGGPTVVMPWIVDGRYETNDANFADYLATQNGLEITGTISATG